MMAAFSSLLHSTCTSSSAAALPRTTLLLLLPRSPLRGERMGLLLLLLRSCCCAASGHSCCCCLLRGVPGRRGEVAGLTRLNSGRMKWGCRLGRDSCRQLWLRSLQDGSIAMDRRAKI